MSVLAVKVFLAPGFVVAASLAMRRFGPQIGGMLGGLPVVAGPILLVFTLQHGTGFGAKAATASLLGLVSLTVFVLVYALLAAHRTWLFSLPAGWLGFLASTAVLSAVTVSAGVGLLVAFGAFATGLLVLRETPEPLTDPGPPPAWDLPVRAVSALVLVVVLTAASSTLGSHLSGLLATFPVITSVLAAFTHSQRSPAEVTRLLRGMLVGFCAYAVFSFVVAVTIDSAGTAAAFTFGIAAAVAAQTVAFVVIQRPRASLAD